MESDEEHTAVSLAQCEGLRTIVSRNERDLNELRDFASLERECFVQWIDEKNKENDEAKQRIADLQMENKKITTEMELIKDVSKVKYTVVLSWP
jgi:hypothetical protein